jgi:predicted PurR-regulated permease PerM
MFGFLKRDKHNQVWVNISNHTIIRLLIAVVIALIILVSLRRAAHALLLIGTAFFLALALNAPVHWLAEHLPGKRRGSRALATTTSFLVVVAIIAAFLISVIPPLTRDTNNFIRDVPHLVQEARDKNSNIGKFIRKYKLQGQVDSFSNQLESRLHNVTGTAVSAVKKLATSVFSVLAILVLTFMMLVEGPYWLGRGRSLVPERHGPHVDKVAHDMYHVIKGYVNGQVLLAAIATALITPALFILHIPDPAALMVVVFTAALIPLIGHTLGMIIVGIVALFHSPWAALIIVIYYILYMQLENYLIQPKIQASTTNLSPLLVFMAVVIGVSFSGLFGGLVAIPVMGCLRVLVVDYLHNHGKLESVDATKEPATPDAKKA